jgi:transcriptional regulator with XRE-family HTH domain
MSNDETFGKRLKAAMDKAGMTMPELGRGMKPKRNGVLEGDLGRAAVWGWQNGYGFPNAVQLAEICRRLHISADYLLFGSINTTNPQVEHAARVLKDLSTEERQALFAVMYGPAAPNERVGQFIEPAPDHELDSDFAALGPPPAPTYKSKGIKPHSPVVPKQDKPKRKKGDE